jgi:hypothetical protein
MSMKKFYPNFPTRAFTIKLFTVVANSVPY